MPNLGLSELLVIAMILLLVFGASRLPALGEGLGRTIRSFKRGLSHDDKIKVSENSESGEGGASGERAESVSARPASSPKAGDEEASDAEIIEKA